MYSAAVRTVVLSISLIFVSLTNVSAQNRLAGFIDLSFSIDGTPAHCDGFKVEIRLNGESMKPRQTGRRFEVPGVFKRPAREWSNGQRVDISLTCSGHTFVFPSQHPAFVQEGDWQLGIARPLYALKEYGYTHELDRGKWLAYLIFEGEPGVITFSAQPNPPDGLSAALQREELNAPPGRARDLAYELSVLDVEYSKNRDYLLSSLNNCLSRPKESPEDDVCDSDLLNFLTNLYWRGDSALLPPLLQIAESRRDVIGDVGIFYADLLDRRGEIVLGAVAELGHDKPELVCRLADEDLSLDAPRRQRVLVFLRGSGGPAAQCLSAFGSN